MMDELQKVREMLVAYSQGLQAVYDEFQKYKLSDLQKRMDYLDGIINKYEMQKDVKEFTCDVASYPMNVRVNMRVKTNFGLCTYSFDYPPALEYQLAHMIQGNYENMLNKLYEAHDARGGKYMGDSGCKAWMDEHGDTILNLGEPKISR